MGAGSSAGLVANHKAGMELMGAWDPGTIASLTPNQKPLPDLRWFPFPSVPGGAGAPNAMMGSFDRFSLSKNAPAAAWQFLEFPLTTPQQEAYAKANVTIPINPAAQGVVTDPSAIEVKNALNKASYTMQFLDTQYGRERRHALNAAVVNLLAGKGTQQGALLPGRQPRPAWSSWAPGTRARSPTLTPNQKPLPDLGWFPFPAVPGGQGDPSAMMGGIDGYSLSPNAPKEAFEFLEFLLTTPQQQAYATAFITLPVNKAAQSVVTDSVSVSALQALNQAGLHRCSSSTRSTARTSATP